MSGVWDYPEEPVVREPVPPRDEDEILQEKRDEKLLEPPVDKVGQQLKVGDKVQYDGSEWPGGEQYRRRFYPEDGTVGCIAYIDPDVCTVWVQWPDGATSDNGMWAALKSCIIKIDEEKADG